MDETNVIELHDAQAVGDYPAPDAGDVEPIRPDHEELTIIVEELGEAKKHLYGLRLVKAHEAAELPDGGTLGTKLYGPHAERNRASRRSDAHRRQSVPFGEELERQLNAAAIRVGIAQALYDEWQARETAWFEAQAKDDDAEKSDAA